MGLRTRIYNGKEQIFCEWRHRWVRLTPEEWVRQQLLHRLVEQLDYPASLIAVEQAINVGDNTYSTSEFDLAGEARVASDVVDAGAYEYQLPVEWFVVNYLLDNAYLENLCVRIDVDVDVFAVRISLLYSLHKRCLYLFRKNLNVNAVLISEHLKCVKKTLIHFFNLPPDNFN